MANIIKQLYEEYGQSLWYDNIARDLLNSGAIQALVDEGIRGLTSNPSIFQKAITAGSAYDDQLRALVADGKPPRDIYEALAVEDIRRAADILRPVYDESGGADGYVSLEVSPLLASDTKGTIDEALRLFSWVDRPNLMIKIPATPEGLPAIESCIAAGLNINVTLIFSRDMYSRVMDAYLNGLKRRADSGQDISRIASVASFFVSRVDTLVDDLLDRKITEDGSVAGHLEAHKGQAAIANAKLAYRLFKEKFASAAYKELSGQGAKLQRPLWASTSTKNAAYSDVIYMDNLIGPHTVNTAPPETIEAFRDHGKLANTLEEGLDEAQATLDALEGLGISMRAVTDELLTDGVEKFAVPFEKLLKAIEEKASAFAGAAAD
jgi:transaldolase